MASSSSNRKIEPAQFGGFGQLKDQPSGGLLGVQFNSRYPPDTPLRSKIIAVVGTSEENASPTDDGWFLSDFYLFHHLLGDVAKDQVWLTCVKPAVLVEKYKEYAHGNPETGERKVCPERIRTDDLRLIKGRLF
jgi:hypothetical protein